MQNSPAVKESVQSPRRPLCEIQGGGQEMGLMKNFNKYTKKLGIFNWSRDHSRSKKQAGVVHIKYSKSIKIVASLLCI